MLRRDRAELESELERARAECRLQRKRARKERKGLEQSVLSVVRTADLHPDERLRMIEALLAPGEAGEAGEAVIRPEDGLAVTRELSPDEALKEREEQARRTGNYFELL